MANKIKVAKNQGFQDEGSNIREVFRKQFCTVEIADKLQKLGFNEECIAEFEHIDKVCVCAPLWQQAVDWLKTKNIFISVMYHRPHSDYNGPVDTSYCIMQRDGDGYLFYHPNNLGQYMQWTYVERKFNPYEKAILEAIDLLTNPPIYE